jgi:hypothetical protein
VVFFRRKIGAPAILGNVCEAVIGRGSVVGADNTRCVDLEEVRLAYHSHTLLPIWEALRLVARAYLFRIVRLG